MNLGDNSILRVGDEDGKESSYHPNQENVPNISNNHEEITNNNFNNGTNHNESNGQGEENLHIEHIVELEHDEQISHNNSISKQLTIDQAASLEDNNNEVYAYGSDADSVHHESEDNDNNNHYIRHQSCSSTHNRSENSTNQTPGPNNDIQESSSTNVPNLQELTQSVTICDDDKSNLQNERKDVSEIKVAFILLILIVVVCSTIYFTLPKKRNKAWF